MLVKTLLKSCGTGFDLVIIADSTSGHTCEYNSVEEARIEAGSDKVIEWEVGCNLEEGKNLYHHEFILFITI